MAEASGIRKRDIGARPEADVVRISQSRASSRAKSAPRFPRARRGRPASVARLCPGALSAGTREWGDR
eukprot:9480221-Pyramimonas_sp.AAC.2